MAGQHVTDQSRVMIRMTSSVIASSFAVLIDNGSIAVSPQTEVRLRSYIGALSLSQRAEAVRAFNSLYGEMEQALWCLSRHCRSALIERNSTAVVEALVWTLKSWWGVQGVRSETKVQLTKALVEAVDWSAELFEETLPSSPDAEKFAFDTVSSVVSYSVSLGVPRREFSLTSKVLHWLMPWRVPVYDSFVRQYLGVPASWDHPQAYRRIVRDVFAIAREADQDLTWAGAVEPLSPLHSLDKCLWWLGGGDSGTAAQVRHPWRVLDQLGLERC